MPKRAFVLAAGLGTRLRPYTELVPKPLFHVLGRPILEIILDQLRAAGFTEIGLNLHHFPEKIEAFLASYRERHPEISLFPFREEELLGPVGAFFGAASFFEEGPVLVVNADVLTNFSFEALLCAHRRFGAVATLLLHAHPDYRNVLLEGERIIGFSPGTGFAYTGLQVVGPELVSLLEPGDRDLVPAYGRLIREGAFIAGLLGAGFYWRDIGTLPSYLAAHGELLKRKAALPGLSPPSSPQVTTGARVGPGVVFEDWVFLEPGVEVEAGARLRRVVAWAGARIPKGLHEDSLFVPDV